MGPGFPPGRRVARGFIQGGSASPAGAVLAMTGFCHCEEPPGDDAARRSGRVRNRPSRPSGW
jgi:hypothetical protein